MDETALQPVTVGLVTKTAEGEETVYRIAPHDPGAHIIHVIWAWVFFVAAAVLFVFFLVAHPRLRPAAAEEQIALILGLLGLFAIALLPPALNVTWWHRTCATGSESIAIRGNLLIHRAKAFGRVREWQEKVDTLFKAHWEPGGSRRHYMPLVVVGNRTVALNVGRDQGGEWLAKELTQAILRLRGWQ